MAAGQHSEVLLQTQLGIENEAGTAVEANVLLTSVEILPKPVTSLEMLRQMGSKIDTAQVGVKGSMTTGKLQGFAAFDDLVYLFSILNKAATISTPEGATLARDWVWVLKARSPEAPLTATFENEIITVDAARWAFGMLTSLKADFELTKSPKLTGDVIGQRLAEKGVTPTASPTLVTSVPVSPNLIDVFIASSMAALPEASRLDALFKYSWEISDRRKPVFAFRSDTQSFSGTVEVANKCLFHLELEKDSDSDDLLSQARGWATRYIQMLATGPAIETVDDVTFSYEWEITMPFKVMNPDRGASDDVYAGMYDLQAVDDPNTGGTGIEGFCLLRIRTPLTALITSTDLGDGQQPEALIAANP